VIFGDTRVPIRFWSRVTPLPTGCWIWERPMPDGYGRLRFGGKGSKFGMAHRFCYERLVGEIPIGLQLDHLCRVRNCVNPNHLELVTSRENTMRGDTPAAKNAAKTHCHRGHEFNEKNTYHVAGRRIRMCRVCCKLNMRKSRAKRKESA
jgi:hypothetical protein